MRARVGGASTLRASSVFAFPLQKILPPKTLRLLNFEPALQVREIPSPPYAALRAARENFSENDASFIGATLYDQVRTFFQQQS